MALWGLRSVRRVADDEGMLQRVDKVLAVGIALTLAVGLLGVASSSQWVGKSFPGFLVLGNRVVASAGLQHWPATVDGEIFQREVVAVEGEPVTSAGEITLLARGVPVGTPLAYTLRGGGTEEVVTVRTRLFTTADFVLLFGSYAVVGLLLCGIALTIRYVKPSDEVANGTALGIFIIGLWGLSATDLYGPYRLFRIHAALECFLFAALLHFALVFPYKKRVVNQLPWLIPGVYLSAAALAAFCEYGLYEPTMYVPTHRLAVGAFAVSLAAVTLALAHSYLRPPSQDARDKVKVLAVGTALAALPGVVLMAGSAATGGQAPENLMGWGGVAFPLAIGYAVLKDDLLGLDGLVRAALSWTLLTVVIGLGYAGLLAGIELAISASSVSRWLVVAIFAVLSTGLVLPLRERTQEVVDRIFFRSTYDFRMLLEESSHRFASLNSRSELIAFVEDMVKEAFQPVWMEFAVRESGEQGVDAPLALSSVSGRPVPDDVRDISPLVDGGLLVPFATATRLAGALAIGPRRSGKKYGAEDVRLLQILASQGAVAVENSLALEGWKEANRTLESRVEKRTAELAETVSNLMEAEVQLVQAERLAAVGELSAGVAHEVNNPLNFARNSLATLRTYVDDVRSIVGLVSGLGAGVAGEELDRRLAELEKAKSELHFDELSDDLGELVGIVTEGLDRTARLVADLRDFAAPDRVEGTHVDVREGLRSTLQLLGHQLREAGCQVETDLQEGLPAVVGNSGALNQVFLNLLKNAAEAIDPKGQGTIRVAAFEEGSEVVVRVQDDGAGMDSEAKSRLFEPFFTTKEAGKRAPVWAWLDVPTHRRASTAGSIDARDGAAASRGATTAVVRLPVDRARCRSGRGSRRCGLMEPRPQYVFDPAGASPSSTWTTSPRTCGSSI